MVLLIHIPEAKIQWLVLYMASSDSQFLVVPVPNILVSIQGSCLEGENVVMFSVAFIYIIIYWDISLHPFSYGTPKPEMMDG